MGCGGFYHAKRALACYGKLKLNRLGTSTLTYGGLGFMQAGSPGAGAAGFLCVRRPSGIGYNA